MISEAKSNGGSFHQTSSANHNAFAGYRVYLFTASVAGLTLTIPTAKAFNKGDKVFAVANVGTNAFQVNDRAGGTLVASLTAGQWLLLTLLNNTTQAGTWVQTIRTRLT